MNYKKQDYWDTDKFAIHLLVTLNGHTEAQARSIMFFTNMMEAWGKRKCKQDGHKMVDTSHGNGESGTMGAQCIRCGWSFSTNLY